MVVNSQVSAPQFFHFSEINREEQDRKKIEEKVEGRK